MFKRQYFVVLVLCALYYVDMCATEKIRYITTERPNFSYLNSRYIRDVNITSRRFGRKNPIHYVDLHFHLLVKVNNNVSLDFSVYEYLANVYRSSFLELHFEVCHLVHNEPIFGHSFKQGKLAKPCPYLPGDYHLYNMTMHTKVIPESFPFRKGRIYLNFTSMDTKDLIATIHLDMEIKEFNFKVKKA